MCDYFWVFRCFSDMGPLKAQNPLLPTWYSWVS
uniref:Uncharacterized protein n=1 Tax=Anguilla anguilla TaxID=7936 RepID=A0A0E9XST4_ANGAN